MMSCVTKMAIIGYGATSLIPLFPSVVLAAGKHVERTVAQDRAQYMAKRFSASLHCNSKQIFSVAAFDGATKPFSNERHPHPLVKSSDVALHLIR